MVTDSSFAGNYGPWAIVTGAAQGVGRAYVDALVERGLSIVALDRDRSVSSLSVDQAEIRPVVADLAEPGWLDALDQATSDLDVGLVVANAGVSTIGRFIDVERADLHRTIAVNTTALVDLAHRYLPRLAARTRSGFVMMSSGSALAGTAGIATYSATKAFAVNLAEALAVEHRRDGIAVQVVIAPSMNTPTFRSHEPDLAAMAVPPVEPAVVVGPALDSLGNGQTVHLADAGLEFLDALPRNDRVPLIAEATAAMYPARDLGN